MAVIPSPGTGTQRSESMKGRRPGVKRRLPRKTISAVGLLAGLFLWWALAEFVFNPILFAGPWETVIAFRDSLANGTWIENTSASMSRIITGYVIGCLIGIPVGLLIGSFNTVRALLDPYVSFLRFVPPIALLPLAIVWFGIDENSKYFLIAFSTSFIVILNAIAGVYSVPKVRVWAAKSLGLSQFDLFYRVLAPSSIPFIITGMRIAMGNAFMTIVAAEMISADSGLGYMIFNARQFFQTGTMFVGIISIGLLGFLADRVLTLVARSALKRFSLHEQGAAA